MQNLEQWQKWFESPSEVAVEQKPAIKFLDPNLRRRASQLSRMALESARCCLDIDSLSTIPVVFGSRHGESRTSQALLEMLGADDLLSPMAFSLSVHNVPTGLLSIATNNRQATTAVAANKQTFCYTLLESLTRLELESSLLMIVGEELVPDILAGPVEEWRVPFALSFVLAGSSDDGGRISVSMRETSAEEEQYCTLSQGLIFARWLFSPELELKLSHRHCEWCFKKESKTYLDIFGAEYC